MTSIDTSLEITRENAIDMQHALDIEQEKLRAELHACTYPAARYRILLRAVINQQRQAVAWELRPGRARDKQVQATHCWSEARLAGVAAEIEQLRATAVWQKRNLPDPLVLLEGIRDDRALEALIDLYTAAAGEA
ncbi:hypothetical protein [Amycolatopsis sp. NPDC051903]|uniref:hypothetical protein n=1 Tax=Amycolatopsis sp. NPDC051903 TaxID=3363936 RepID=UPI00379F3D0E